MHHIIRKNNTWFRDGNLSIFPRYSKTLWHGHFWPHGHNLNNIGRGCISNIKALGLVISDMKFFLLWLQKTCGTWAGPFLATGP